MSADTLGGGEYAVLRDLWPDFSPEARERLGAIGDGLLRLEAAPGDEAILDLVKREAHNLKGAAATLGLRDVEAVAHALEDAVAAGVTRDIVSVGVRALAALESALDAGDAGCEVQVPDAAALLAALGARTRRPDTRRGAGGSGGPHARWAAEVFDELAAALQGFQAAAGGADGGPLLAAGRVRALQRAGEREWAAGVLGRVAEGFGRLAGGGADVGITAAAIADDLVSLGAEAERLDGEADGAAAPGPAPAEADRSARPPSPSSPDRGVRVSAATLDALTARVVEVALGQGRHDFRARDMLALGSRLRELHAHLERVLADLARADEARPLLEALRARADDAARLGREGVRDAEGLKLAAQEAREDLRGVRMVRAGSVLEPLRRAIRDVAGRLGKSVEVHLSGSEVRADRHILDGVKDALLHLVRNAVDHGLEDADARLAAGKAPGGRIEVGVEARGGRLLVWVADDGRGLNLTRIRAKAAERGLVGSEQASRLSDRDAMRLIFHRGFSTAAAVTEVSGRGVGLDVVQEAVGALQGTVEVSSEPGRGTRFELDVPATVASASGVVVALGGDVAVLPADAVERIVVLDGERVTSVGGSPALRVGGNVVPVASLATTVGLAEAGSGALRAAVVVSGAGGRAALVVDAVRGFQDVVVAPLRGRLGRVPHVLGTAQLEDGQLVAVLNPVELVRRVRGGEVATATRKRRVVVTDDSLTTRAAMKNLLEVAGFAVVTAADGVEALEFLRASRGDLVVSDVQMPRMDGLELTRRIKADPALARTPVILVTSLDAADEREAGLRAGADGYVVKREVERGRLLELVQQLLPAEPAT